MEKQLGIINFYLRGLIHICFNLIHKNVEYVCIYINCLNIWLFEMFKSVFKNGGILKRHSVMDI